MEGDGELLYIYADHEYGDKSIIKICFNRERINQLLNQWKLREELI